MKRLTEAEWNNTLLRLMTQGMRAPERIISSKAHQRLLEIREKYPNWDKWSTEAEIHVMYLLMKGTP